MSISVLLADDQPLLRRGFRMILEAEPDLIVVAEAGDGEEAVDLEVVGTPGPLAPSVDLTAYRIVQEALTNTIRHARAARAAVSLRYEPGHVTVSIADSGRRPGERAPDANGHGTAKPGPLLAGSGLGLAGIAERVASCGGNLTVGPAVSGGFAVTARLPAR